MLAGFSYLPRSESPPIEPSEVSHRSVVMGVAPTVCSPGHAHDSTTVTQADLVIRNPRVTPQLVERNEFATLVVAPPFGNSGAIAWFWLLLKLHHQRAGNGILKIIRKLSEAANCFVE